MNMREMFVNTTNELINKDNRVALILAGISVASSVGGLHGWGRTKKK